MMDLRVFEELSQQTLEELGDDVPILETKENDLVDYLEPEEEEPLELRTPTLPVKLPRTSKKAPVVAIDASSTKVAETPKGVVYAVRASYVVLNGSYTYVSTKPFIFFVSEENKKDLYEELLEQCFGLRRRVNPPSLYQMRFRLARILERVVQLHVAREHKRSIILWDGALIAGTVDTPTGAIQECVESARDNGNITIAFSKKSRLYVNGKLITCLLEDYSPPVLLDVSQPAKEIFGSRQLGDVYVVKLGYLPFRVDIDSFYEKETQLESLASLLASDVGRDGYPNSLKIAHLSSKIDPLERMALWIDAELRSPFSLVEPFPYPHDFRLSHEAPL